MLNYMQVRGVEFAHALDHLRDRRHYVWLKVRESAKDSFMVAELGSVHAFDIRDPFCVVLPDGDA